MIEGFDKFLDNLEKGFYSGAEFRVETVKEPSQDDLGLRVTLINLNTSILLVPACYCYNSNDSNGYFLLIKAFDGKGRKLFEVTDVKLYKKLRNIIEDIESRDFNMSSKKIEDAFDLKITKE